MNDEAPRYSISREIAAYSQAIIETFPEEFSHLEEAHVGYLMTPEEIKIRGRYCAAFVQMPQVQGNAGAILLWALEHTFSFIPDVLMVVSEEYWQEAGDKAKVALIYHELCHIKQKEGNRGPIFSKDDGRPVLQLVDHDLGEFFDVVGKFGDWDAGIRVFMERLGDKTTKLPAGVVKTIISMVDKKLQRGSNKVVHLTPKQTAPKTAGAVK